jgi:hypothetical protein
MEELRVPKRRAPAEVVLAGGASRRVVLFLAEAAADHAGSEQPSDLVNGAGDFIPALDAGSGEMTFLQRGALALIRVAPALETAGAEDLTLPTEHEIEVHLADGSAHTGLVTYLRPADRSRLADFLNEPSPFFRLLQADAVALVNKRHVTRVVLLAR